MQRSDQFTGLDLAQTQRFAVCLGQLLQPGIIIFLKGQLGAGKTTLVRSLLHSLGYDGLVKSPTFTVVESYEVRLNYGAVVPFFHFDLYRLNSPSELFEMGFEDYLSQQSILCIEWPEKAESTLPVADLQLSMQVEKTGCLRSFQLEASTSRGVSLLENLIRCDLC